MARSGRDSESRVFFAMCNRLQTVCEQPATVFAPREGGQQFVNQVQQIATSTDSKDHSQAAQNPVVEHKVGMRSWVSWRSFCCCGCGSGGMRFGGPASRLRCAPDLRFPPSQTASTIPLQIERRSRMAQRAIRFSETTDKGICRWRRKRGPLWRAKRDQQCGYAMDFDWALRSRSQQRPASHARHGCRAATLVALGQLKGLPVARENCGWECDH